MHKGLLIGICGKAGSGKNAIADILAANRNTHTVALADPLKRICRDVFKFTDEQLWGASEFRNKPDQRYLHKKKGSLGTTVDAFGDRVDVPHEDQYLTPRIALQQLGTEWGRYCAPDIWVAYALDVYDVLWKQGCPYDPKLGVYADPLFSKPDKWAMVVPDVRFENEILAIKKKGGLVWRIDRPGAGLRGMAGQHVSETEQDRLPGTLFDYTFTNNGTLQELEDTVLREYDTAVYSRRTLR